MVFDGSYSYEAAAYGLLTKLLLLVTALGWLGMILLLAPERKIVFISEIGANTFPIFILHGFVVRTFSLHNIFRFGLGWNLLVIVILSLIMMAIFGNRWMNHLFQKVF